MEGTALLPELDRLHTTPMGAERIKRNLGLDVAMDAAAVTAYCGRLIGGADCAAVRRGKNWYCTAGGVRFTVNAGSLTVITAHRSEGGGT